MPKALLWKHPRVDHDTYACGFEDERNHPLITCVGKNLHFFRFRHRLVPEFGSPWESHNVQQTVTAGQAEGLLAQSGLPLQRWALRLPPQCLV